MRPPCPLATGTHHRRPAGMAAELGSPMLAAARTARTCEPLMAARADPDPTHIPDHEPARACALRRNRHTTPDPAALLRHGLRTSTQRTALLRCGPVTRPADQHPTAPQWSTGGGGPVGCWQGARQGHGGCGACPSPTLQISHHRRRALDPGCGGPGGGWQAGRRAGSTDLGSAPNPLGSLRSVVVARR